MNINSLNLLVLKMHTSLTKLKVREYYICCTPNVNIVSHLVLSRRFLKVFAIYSLCTRLGDLNNSIQPSGFATDSSKLMKSTPNQTDAFWSTVLRWRNLGRAAGKHRNPAGDNQTTGFYIDIFANIPLARLGPVQQMYVASRETTVLPPKLSRRLGAKVKEWPWI